MVPLVPPGNRKTDTKCRFRMAEIQQGGGARASRFAAGKVAQSDLIDPLPDRSLLPDDKSTTFVDTV